MESPHRFPPSVRSLPALLLLTLFHADPQAGEVFRWQDAQGHTHYSDHAPAEARRLPIRAEPAASLRRVEKVYDGDTIQLAGGEKVRLLGINTPEIEHFGKPGEAGGPEALRWLRERLAGQAVRLEPDAESRDHYGRTLAHVFLDGGEHINRTLVEQGLACIDIHPPNLKYAEVLAEAERQAETAGRGIWARPEYAPLAADSLRDASLRGWHRITGTPIRMAVERNYRRLVFSGRFELRIPKQYLHRFPAPESWLRRSLEVRGWVSGREGRLWITAKDPSAVVLR